MKVCKQCNAMMEDGLTTCLICGGELVEEEISVEEAPVEEIPAEETPVEETPAEPKKKLSKGLIVALVAAVLVIVAVIIGKGVHDRKQAEPEAPVVEAPAETPEEAPAVPPVVIDTVDITAALHTNAYGFDSYSIHNEIHDDGTVAYCYMNEAGELIYASEESINALLDQVIATCGEQELTNRDLQYYYQNAFYAFYSSYSSYLSLMMDTAIGLDEQANLDGVDTWQMYFLDDAIALFRQIAALCQAGEAEGHTLTAEEQAQLDANTDMDAMAAAYGYDNVEAFLFDYVGPYATAESYANFVRSNVYATSYANALAQRLTFTDEEVEAYYDENANMFLSTYGIEKIDKPMLSVRHILITPEAAEDGTISDDAWAAAETEAQRIYDEWKSGAATEESFADMAGQYTQDPGSQSTGGLYENVYPGQMVPEFNDWCFADGRQIGDHGIVKTTYGYHIMFFSGWGDEIYWRLAAESELMNHRAAEDRAALTASYQTSETPELVVVMDGMAPTVPVVEEAPAEEVPAE